MELKTFEHPARIATRDGTVCVTDARQAAEILSRADWPTHGPRHRDALDACLKVIDGHRSTIDAETAFAAAAQEAHILLDR